MLKITTWNINSLRLRLPLVAKLAKEENPDILCLQETKVIPDHFPVDGVKALGFPHLYYDGIKGYNGVAIFSKKELTPLPLRPWVGKEDARHISCKLPTGEILHNFYVPAGGDIPDRKENPKFGHKLDFVRAMGGWFAEEYKKTTPMILVGDLNIAPLPEDVWSHKQLLNVVSHTPIEVDHFNKMIQSADWQDALRHFIPEDQKLYTWWSYRARDWQKSNRGRRLDHVWLTKPLMKRLAAMNILEEARGWESPSDHVPVSIILR